MRKTINRIVAAVMALTTVGSLFLTVVPAQAAVLTSTSDTLSREKISVTAVNHTLSTTLPSVSTGTAILFDYSTAGFSSLAQNGSTGACASGTCSMTVSATDVIITCTAGPCSGLFTQTGTFTATNPGTAGSKSVSYAQAYGDPVSGTFAIPIMDDDQVTVSATVSPSITFDIDTATTDTNTSAPYTVALGTISTSDGRVSGTVDGVNYIWLDLDTNASGGAVVTVTNANGSSGLKSTGTPADTIPSANATQANGTANYGLCVGGTSATTGVLRALSPFNSTCTPDVETNTVGGLTGAAQNIIDSGTTSAAVAGGRAQIIVNAAVSTTTQAHNDYADTLTFIATGTF